MTVDVTFYFCAFKRNNTNGTLKNKLWHLQSFWSVLWGCFNRALSINDVTCFIFRPGFGCCALQTLVQILFFNVFCAKRLKRRKGKKFEAKFSKTNFAPARWSMVLFLEKNKFSVEKTMFYKQKAVKDCKSGLLLVKIYICLVRMFRIWWTLFLQNTALKL